MIFYIKWKRLIEFLNFQNLHVTVICESFWKLCMSMIIGTNLF